MMVLIQFPYVIIDSKTWSFVVKRKQAPHNIADGRLLTQGIKWRFYVIWLQAAISDSRCIFEDNLGNES